MFTFNVLSSTAVTNLISVLSRFFLHLVFVQLIIPKCSACNSQFHQTFYRPFLWYIHSNLVHEVIFAAYFLLPPANKHSEQTQPKSCRNIQFPIQQQTLHKITPQSFVTTNWFSLWLFHLPRISLLVDQCSMQNNGQVFFYSSSWISILP